MNGITFDEARNRWRCFHKTRSGRVLQPRFPTEYEAVWHKLFLCAQDGYLPYGKHVKEGAKSGKGQEISRLPVGVRETWSKRKQVNLVVASVPSGISSRSIEYRYRTEDERQAAITKATWDRFELCWNHLLQEVEKHRPIKDDVIVALEKSVTDETQRELMRCFDIQRLGKIVRQKLSYDHVKQ